MMALLLVGCGEGQSTTVRLDGSSTVYPISNAAAEMFSAKHPGIRIPVGVSGTGGGFKKFLEASPDLRTDINDASRPIKSSELARAKKLGVKFIEMPIAIDGIAVMVNPKNSFCDHLTVAELKRIWEPDSKIVNWKEVRTGFPDVPLKLYGPGTDSGTFDYFTEVICGKSKASRSDYSANENDNVLVTGIAGDAGGLGYFGYSYYAANKDKLKLLAIDPGNGTPIAPSLDVIRSGSYRPLSRPLFLYVNQASAKRPEVRSFLDFYLENAKAIVEHPQVNYVALSEKLYDVAQKRLHDGVIGTLFTGVSAEAATTLNERYGIQ